MCLKLPGTSDLHVAFVCDVGLMERALGKIYGFTLELWKP